MHHLFPDYMHFGLLSSCWNKIGNCIMCLPRPFSNAQGHIAMAAVSQHVVPLVFSQLIRGRICNSNKPDTFNQLWTVEEQVHGCLHVWDHTGRGKGGELRWECDAEPQLPHLMVFRPHGKGEVCAELIAKRSKGTANIMSVLSRRPQRLPGYHSRPILCVI